ncbi:hypothetical protein [Halorarius halobius]|uniref:hypothetical protein n=1 Tax=Halorarius halobius TaxID=2962671 RepID=UPI0020CD51BB|nr:hypothetical protein [Halorarius halobius]
MARMEGDWLDFALAGLFTLATAVTVGIATVQIFDVQFSDAVVSLGGSSLDVATLFSLGTLAFMFITNDNTSVGDLGEFDDVYGVSLVATVGLTLAIPLVPAVEDLVTSSDFLRTAVVGVMSVGYATAAWIR